MMVRTNQILCVDCFKLLKQLKDNSVPLIITDPPYNTDYKYDGFKDSREDYWEWCENWLKECYRVLATTGSIYVKQHQKNIFQKGVLMQKVGFKFQNLIIWKNVSGFPSKNRYVKSYEGILFFTKSEGFTFNTYAQRAPITSWTPTKEERLKGQMNDLWDDIKFIYTGVQVHPEAILKLGTREKAHPCQMPLELARRMILFSSNKNDLVLDIFNGSGTTTLAAQQLGRKFLGCDINPEYCQIARNRLKQKTCSLYYNGITV